MSAFDGPAVTVNVTVPSDSPAANVACFVATASPATRSLTPRVSSWFAVLLALTVMVTVSPSHTSYGFTNTLSKSILSEATTGASTVNEPVAPSTSAL